MPWVFRSIYDHQRMLYESDRVTEFGSPQAIIGSDTAGFDNGPWRSRR
jgi:hypothetical protein